MFDMCTDTWPFVCVCVCTCMCVCECVCAHACNMCPHIHCVFLLAGLTDPEAKEKCMLSLLLQLPEPNKSTVNFMLDHLVR